MFVNAIVSIKILLCHTYCYLLLHCLSLTFPRIPALMRISSEKNTIKSLKNDIKQLNNKLAELQSSLEAKEDEISQLRR
jgi:septal ring factor EnvC (AmiA/AmiB activator)